MQNNLKEQLFNSAKSVINNSYSPYSNYKVAAALHTTDGKIFTGVNVENSSYGLTNCAERSAIFSAVTNGYKEFDSILIMTIDGSGYPCGACRQVLSEFNPEMTVMVADYNEIKDEITLDKLLPHSFKGDFLKK